MTFHIKTAFALAATACGLAAAGWAVSRYQQTVRTQQCQSTPTHTLETQAMAQLLQMAITAVAEHNAEIDQKAEALKGPEFAPLAGLILEGLNPRFRMTPPQLSDLQKVITLRPGATPARAQAGTPLTCKWRFNAHLSSGEVLPGTLQWQMPHQSAERFEVTGSYDLLLFAGRFGTDLNRPLYELTQHQSRVDMGYYTGKATRRKSAKAEALATKTGLYKRWALPASTRFTVPMDLPTNTTKSHTGTSVVGSAGG